MVLGFNVQGLGASGIHPFKERECFYHNLAGEIASIGDGSNHGEECTRKSASKLNGGTQIKNKNTSRECIPAVVPWEAKIEFTPGVRDGSPNSINFGIVPSYLQAFRTLAPSFSLQEL
jgi:hypothetical protein